MKKFKVFALIVLSITFKLNAQVNPLDSAYIWDQSMMWNSTKFVNDYNIFGPFNPNAVNQAGGTAWQNGRVTELTWGNTDILQGNILSTIGTLTELQKLILTGSHNLTGNIPHEIGNLTNLKQVSLNETGLTGSIPNEIGNLINLENLSLGYYPYSYNGLSGYFPHSMRNLAKLKTFWLVNSSVEGNIPGSWGLLDSLEMINITHNNKFGGLLTDSLCLSNSLVGIDIRGSQFYGKLPDCLPYIPTIVGITINGCFFTDTIPPSIINPPRIFLVEAENNKFSYLPLIPINSKVHFDDLIGNQFQFGDFENNYFNGCWNCIGAIAPQDSVWSVLDTTVLINTNVILNSIVTGQYNTYHWYKNGVLVGNNGSGLWEIPNVQHSDSGVYTCDVTNAYITVLTLNRLPITLHVVNALGSNEIANTNLLPEVFPNPFKQTLTVKLKSTLTEPTTLSLINASGKIVMQAKTNVSEYVFNTEQLPAGLYLLKAETGRSVATVKVNKE